MRNLHLGLYTPNQGVPKHSGSLFHSTRATTEKKKILEEEFGVAMNEELEREVLVMCNLSQGVKAEGISIGEMRMLVKQVRKGRVTIEEAAEDAGMTVEEFKKILENEQSGHRKSFECEKGIVPSCTKTAERCKAEPAFPQER